MSLNIGDDRLRDYFNGVSPDTMVNLGSFFRWAFHVGAHDSDLRGVSLAMMVGTEVRAHELMTWLRLNNKD